MWFSKYFGWDLFRVKRVRIKRDPPVSKVRVHILCGYEFCCVSWKDDQIFPFKSWGECYLWVRCVWMITGLDSIRNPSWFYTCTGTDEGSRILSHGPHLKIGSLTPGVCSLIPNWIWVWDFFFHLHPALYTFDILPGRLAETVRFQRRLITDLQPKLRKNHSKPEAIWAITTIHTGLSQCAGSSLCKPCRWKFVPLPPPKKIPHMLTRQFAEIQFFGGNTSLHFGFSACNTDTVPLGNTWFEWKLLNVNNICSISYFSRNVQLSQASLFITVAS